MTVANRKRIWGWIAFDWASQPYYTLGLTFIFGPYFVGVASSVIDAPPEAADARAQSMWSLGQTIAGLCVAFAGPVIGSWADTSGRRIPWILGFSVVYVLAAASLWWVGPDGAMLWFGLMAFSLGFIAAEFALIFTNAILPSLGSPKEIGKISGTGASIGYWGGVLALFVMLLFFFEADAGSGVTLLGQPPAFGLDPAAREGTRIVGPFIAAWYLVFIIPFFLWVREPVTGRRGSFAQALSGLVASVKGVRHRPSLAAFLLGSMFYRDALGGLYAFGGIYARLVLDWSLTFIAVFGIIGAVTAAVFTYIGGVFDRRLGPKPVIVVSILVLVAVCTIVVGMSRTMIFGVPLPPGSSLPDTLFLICGAAIGGAGGALYAASRSMMVRHANPDRPTEAFALFALAGRATAFMAPALIGIVSLLTENARLGIAPLIALFAIGLLLLVWVKPEGDGGS